MTPAQRSAANATPYEHATYRAIYRVYRRHGAFHVGDYIILHRDGTIELIRAVQPDQVVLDDPGLMTLVTDYGESGTPLRLT